MMEDILCECSNWGPLCLFGSLYAGGRLFDVSNLVTLQSSQTDFFGRVFDVTGLNAAYSMPFIPSKVISGLHANTLSRSHVHRCGSIVFYNLPSGLL